MSTLNKANKSKMEMNVLANEDGTKNFISSRFSFCCRVSMQCMSSEIWWWLCWENLYDHGIIQDGLLPFLIRISNFFLVSDK